MDPGHCYQEDNTHLAHREQLGWEVLVSHNNSLGYRLDTDSGSTDWLRIGMCHCDKELELLIDLDRTSLWDSQLVC